MYSQGFEDKDNKEEEEDAEDKEATDTDMSEENTPPPQSGQRIVMQREKALKKKPITVDEKGEPYMALVGTFHADL